MEITSVTTFVKYYEKLRARTVRVIACIPSDKFDWTPGANKFSFADLIRHLAATERFMFAENVRGNRSVYPGHEPDLARSREDVLQFFDEMHRESIEIFSNLSDEDLQKKCSTPGDVQITVWKWLRALAEHEIHHRGQIYAYLGFLEIPVPPLYGLTSEEVREKSQAGKSVL